MIQENKYTKVAFTLMCISAILIVSGCMSACVISLKSDKEGISLRMEKVENYYDEISKSYSNFETTRKQIYSTVFDNTYDSLYEQDQTIKNTLSNYEAMIDEIEKTIKVMDKLCVDTYYPDSKINVKCSDYKKVYEKVNNVFVNDIELYNQNIKKYNEFQKVNSTDLSIKTYDTSREYIDYNRDGVIEEKDEEK